MADGIGAVRFGDANNTGTALPTPLTLSATGLTSAVFTGDVALPQFTVEGTLDGPTRLPGLTLTASGVAGTIAAADADLRALSAAGTLLPGTAGLGDANLPALELHATTGVAGDIDLPRLALAATAVNGTAASANVTAPALALSATLLQHGTAAGDAALQSLTLAATATASGVAVGSVTLPAFALDAENARGNTMSATLTIPALTLDASGAMDASGTASLTLPVLLLGTAGGAIAQAVQALPDPVMSGVVLNTRTRAVSAYSGIAANSACVFGGVVLLATNDGILALAGDTDQGAVIDAHLLGGNSDFGDERFKRVLTGYVGYRADGDLQLTLITDSHHTYEYRLLPRRIDDQHASRVKFGRGVDGRYWQWKLENKAGAHFALDALTFNLTPLGKRVG